jgi:hypothetical protein
MSSHALCKESTRPLTFSPTTLAASLVPILSMSSVGSVPTPTAFCLLLAVELIVRFPIPQDELDRLKTSVASNSDKKEAIVFGHGLWSNLDLKKSLDWLDTVLQTVKSANRKQWHGLFVTPNAAGKEKPDDWIVAQGNKALMLFEEAIAIEAGKRGIEHLGTWNMSIQSNKYDGVHLDMKGNLVKTMMVMNWLNLIEH